MKPGAASPLPIRASKTGSQVEESNDEHRYRTRPECIHGAVDQGGTAYGKIVILYPQIEQIVTIFSPDVVLVETDGSARSSQTLRQSAGHSQHQQRCYDGQDVQDVEHKVKLSTSSYSKEVDESTYDE